MNIKPFYLCVALLLHGWASASDLSVSDALKRLIEQQEAAEQRAPNSVRPATANSAQDNSRKQVQLNSGETLEVFIRRTWPGLPVKEPWVKKAYIELNNEAFINGNPNLLRPGSVLTIPSRQDLRNHYSAQYPGIASLFNNAVASSEEAKTHQETRRPLSQSWVRFP
jgi:Tfp pilus assembly protein FimV